MGRSYEIDLQLQWFCSGDLIFGYSEDLKCEVGFFTVTSPDEKRKHSPFLILRRGTDYRIGQLYDFEHDERDDHYTGNQMRHTSIVRQNYQLPYNIPADAYFFGPMSAVNMMRIIRAVQAKLADDQEVRDDALTSLREYYEEKRAMSTLLFIPAFKRA